MPSRCLLSPGPMRPLGSLFSLRLPCWRMHRSHSSTALEGASKFSLCPAVLFPLWTWPVSVAPMQTLVDLSMLLCSPQNIGRSPPSSPSNGFKPQPNPRLQTVYPGPPGHRAPHPFLLLILPGRWTLRDKRFSGCWRCSLETKVLLPSEGSL